MHFQHVPLVRVYIFFCLLSSSLACQYVLALYLVSQIYRWVLVICHHCCRLRRCRDASCHCFVELGSIFHQKNK